jgi:hypothetical protein
MVYRTELLDFLTVHSIKVACIQETKFFAPSKAPSFPGYTVIRKDRLVGSGGGLMTLIYHSVSYTNVDSSLLTILDQSLKLLAVQIDIGSSKLEVFNVYLPPISSCPPGHKPDFAALLDFPGQDALFLEDFNAHHATWFSDRDPADSQGDLLASVLESSSFCSLNADLSSHLPFNNDPGSSPDISLAPAHLLPSLTWCAHTSLNSDHLPITISFLTDDLPPRARRSFTNFKLADWASFIWVSEDAVSKLEDPTNCARDEQMLRSILLDASRHHIPSGYRKDFVAGLPNSAKHLITECDKLRARDPADPEIQGLNARITEAVRKTSRQSWIEKVESSTLKNNPGKCWSLINKGIT